MSVTIQRYRAECPGCGNEVVDSSEKWVRSAAGEHEDACDDLADDQTIDVEEVLEE